MTTDWIVTWLDHLLDTAPTPASVIADVAELTALTRATQEVYLMNFNPVFFE